MLVAGFSALVTPRVIEFVVRIMLYVIITCIMAVNGKFLFGYDVKIYEN